MTRRAGLALGLLLLASSLVAGAVSVTTVDETRHVTRALAFPALLPDLVVWRVDVDPSAVVVVDARSGDASPFWLRFEPWDAPAPQSPVPGSRQSPTLSGAVAGSWRVELDPALGARVDVTVRFHGHVGSEGGRPWPFTLTDVRDDGDCAQGSCLP